MADLSKITEAQFLEIYKLPSQTLRGLKAKGGDPEDARTIFALLRQTTRKPDSWREFFAEDEDSAEYWKKEKEKETVRGLRLKNSLTEGEQFRREDVDAAKMALGSAFKLALMEAQSQMPPQLAGLDEAGVEKILSEGFAKILGQLSDLSSSMWQSILKKYANDEDSQPGGGGHEAESAHAGKPVVSRKRAAGSRSGPEA